VVTGKGWTSAWHPEASKHTQATHQNYKKKEEYWVAELSGCGS
jgi:hypothetical protein